LQYDIEVEGELRRVIVQRIGDGFAVELDGRRWHVDAVRIDAHTLSLIVGTMSGNGDAGERVERVEMSRGIDGRPVPGGVGGSSHEVTISTGKEGQSVAHVGSTPLAIALDGRRRRKGEDGTPRDGPQRIAAPMPGKVVRVLVATGDLVRARQPLVVVEAMKMENELRAGHDGTIAAVHVKEGASVEAGAPLSDIL
jgi:biotin carboxyl carrier protein